MVNISSIRQSNQHLDTSSVPQVAVFVGGTAGIGKITLAEIAGHGTSFKAYVIVRKASAGSAKQYFEELQKANPNTMVILVEGEISLLSEVKRICDHIKTLESQIDLLFMTTGYAPSGGRQSITSLCDYRHKANVIRIHPKAWTPVIHSNSTPASVLSRTFFQYSEHQGKPESSAYTLAD